MHSKKISGIDGQVQFVDLIIVDFKFVRVKNNRTKSTSLCFSFKYVIGKEGMWTKLV